MADLEISELQRQILEAATRVAAGSARAHGYPAIYPLIPHPANVYDDLNFAAHEAVGFGTGYDVGTGTTTIPFTTDVSILGGADILTG